MGSENKVKPQASFPSVFERRRKVRPRSPAVMRSSDAFLFWNFQSNVCTVCLLSDIIGALNGEVLKGDRFEP